jgi:5-methylcytosine-specific restriction endonuclease McrA
VQDLLRHTVPNGDPAVIFEKALTLLLAELERTRLAAASRPQPSRGTDGASRHIPAAVRRSVWQRDGGRCAFNGSHGRCTETSFLEYHHVVPFAEGGDASTSNIELRCRAHNQYEADLWVGASQWPAVRPALITVRLKPDTTYCGGGRRAPVKQTIEVGVRALEDKTREPATSAAVLRCDKVEPERYAELAPIFTQLVAMPLGLSCI